MSLFLALFQCQNRQSSLSNGLSSKSICESWRSFSDASVVHGGLQASPREFMLCHCCPKGPQVFHLHLPRNTLGTRIASHSPLPHYLEFLPQWHTNLVPTSGTSQLLFSVWKCSSLINLHKCCFLLNERSSQMGLERCFPWPPQMKYPYPPHLPYHRSFRS